MIALLLAACVHVPTLDPATAGPSCSRLHYPRTWYGCRDLFVCSLPSSSGSVRAWVQIRPVSRTVPAMRLPIDGCDPQDPACLTGAIERGIALACQ